MTEQWKNIEGTTYHVSNYGNVKNRNEKVLKKRLKSGYYQVILYTDDKPRDCSVHRLVAIAFILNPENKQQVNHKDKNRLNNHIENLEWCSVQENSRHSCDNGRYQYYRKVLQYDLNNNFLQEFPSVKEANESLGRPPNNGGITRCARGQLKSTGGFRWKYETEDNKEKTPIVKLYKIPDFPNYKINKNGQIYSEHHGRYLKQFINSNGHLMAGLSIDNKTNSISVHRLVAEIFIPNPDNKEYVSHKDGNKQNNHKDNLFWATASECTKQGLNRKKQNENKLDVSETNNN